MITTFLIRIPWIRFEWLNIRLLLSFERNMKNKMHDVILQSIIIIMLWNRNFLVPSHLYLECATITFFPMATAFPTNVKKQTHNIHYFKFYILCNYNININSTYCYQWSTQGINYKVVVYVLSNRWRWLPWNHMQSVLVYFEYSSTIHVILMLCCFVP